MGGSSSKKASQPLPTSTTSVTNFGGSNSNQASSLTQPLPSSSTTSDSKTWRRHYCEADSKELLAIEPNELRFPFETMKRASCSVQLTNRTDDNIAFKVMASNYNNYSVWPNRGLVPPRLTCTIIVTRGPQREAPPHTQCVDKFIVLSAVVEEATKKSDITKEMFKKGSGNVVNQVSLTAVYVQPPRLPSPEQEGSGEGSPPRPSSSDWGNINCQDTKSTLHSVRLQHLKDITNNFCDERILGRGGFGVVFKGVLGNGKAIAVKKFVQSMSSSHEQFENEVNLLRKLEHTNIVRLVGFCYETQPSQKLHEGKFIFAWDIECLLCLEYLPKGSLDKYISGITFNTPKNLKSFEIYRTTMIICFKINALLLFTNADSSSGLDWPTRFKIIEGISYGLQYLHEQFDGPIVHLDLKPSNILLDENMIPKITDFGLSRLFDQEQTIHTIVTRGTLGYMPPEYLRGIITPMSDIFSLGVLIMEVITGHREYPDDISKSSTEFIELELQRWRNVLQKQPGYTSLETDCQQIKICIQIGLVCVNSERTRRPTMKKIIDMLQGLEIMNCYINELTPLSTDAS